ncbi:MAG: 2Fe-2S iron-sulfur cluster-binding protein, partial [Bacteroidetes bacterium]|nr:2Fe-2S iron-sulfur cluster-binding protein [Bacteroidota bacterium]
MEFILNHQTINTDQPSGMTVLDFVRYHQHLTATKIGCREGDCGACTVLVGDLENGKVRYQSMTSCLTPLGNIRGKHVVTLEGLNVSGLSSIQKALVDEGGTQCGFCTPGFIVSFYGFALSERPPSRDESIMAIDGNICRCTGYKSIERAAERINKLLATKDLDSPVGWLVEKGIIPDYFKDIPSRLLAMRSKLILRDNRKNGKKI